MAIQLVDNFQLNVAVPMDSRIVASGSVARDAIQYKYEGLRVFDLSDGVPYVWRNGIWSGENSSSIYGAGTASYLPKYNANNTLNNSVILESSSNILIGTTTNTSPVAKLQVGGNIRSTGGFYGDGANITNLNASYIATGTMNINRLSLDGSTGYMLVRNASSAYWGDPNSISVGNSNKVKINNDTGSSVRYVLFYDISGTATFRDVQSSTTKSITIQPSSGNVGVNLGSTAPTSTLDVNGLIRMRGSSPGKGKLLVSDSSGFASWATQSEVSVPVGSIIMWSGPSTQIPKNWKLCDGTAVPNSSELYTLLISWGSGDKVPDLRERFVVGAGGLNTTNPTGGTGYTVGQVDGSNTVTLTAAQIPQHTHSVDALGIPSSGAHSHSVYKGNGSGGGGFDIGANVESGWYGGNSGNHTHTVPAHNTNSTGGGSSHENRPPFYALCFIIKIN